MSPRKNDNMWTPPRRVPRFPHLRELSLIYEGRSEQIAVRAPDISPQGMFINTANQFPEGAVLKVKFQLARTNVQVSTRCEVRYCLPGVGIGVEFVEIPPDAVRAIEKEVRLTSPTRTRKS